MRMGSSISSAFNGRWRAPWPRVGECIVRFRQRRPGDGIDVPFQLQVLEPDYLDHNKTLSLDTGTIIEGVQFDKIGRRVAYWMFGNHPGCLT